MGFTGGKNDIGAGTDTDFMGACTPAQSKIDEVFVYVRHRHLRTLYTLVILITGVISHLSETKATQLICILQ